MRIAFLADIHGNLPALDVVLADLQAQSPDAVYLVGDQINRCPWNNQVLDILDAQGWPAIAGNHELVVGIIGTPKNRYPFTERRRFEVLWWTWENLHPDHLHAIRLLPEQLLIEIDGAPAIRLVHGIPGNAETGFYAELNDDIMAGYLTGIAEPVVICAHTHRPLDRHVDSWHVINGGAVGLPYNGDPRAQYVLLDLVQENGCRRWRPTFRQLEYDRQPVLDAFETSGLLEAASPLVKLDLLTIETGHPWTSDFGIWLRGQPKSMRKDLEVAMNIYLYSHGPHNWAFDERLMAEKR